MWFTFLGRVSGVHGWLARRSVLLVPANAVLLVVLGLLLAASVRELAQPRAEQAPRVVTIGELGSGAIPEGTYVAVEAQVDPRYTIEVTQTSVGFGRRRVRASSHTTTLLPLVDPAGATGLLLEMGGRPAPRGRVTIDGVVHRLPRGARDVIVRESSTLPSRMNPQWMLSAGRPPEASAIAAVVCLVVGVPLLALLLYVAARKGVIFRADEAAALRHARPSPQGQQIDMRVSGVLRLPDGPRRRFVEEQAQAVVMPSGGVAVGADTSVGPRWSDRRLRRLQGSWHTIVPAGGVERVTRGWMASGGGIRPAAILSVGAERRSTVALSFGDEGQRERFLQALEHYCGPAARQAA